MARVAFGITITVCGAGLWFALEEFRYLAPYGKDLFRTRGFVICGYVAALAIDLFAFLYWTCRRLGLGDTGRKLRRLEREVHRGTAFDNELAERLRRQREGSA